MYTGSFVECRKSSNLEHWQGLHIGKRVIERSRLFPQEYYGRYYEGYWEKTQDSEGMLASPWPALAAICLLQTLSRLSCVSEGTQDGPQQGQKHFLRRRRLMQVSESTVCSLLGRLRSARWE